MAIEVTEEMVSAWRDAFNQAAADAIRSDAPFQTGDITRAGLAAVLAIVERNQAGPCSAVLPSLIGTGEIWCELRHGHAGDHTAEGGTRWKAISDPCLCGADLGEPWDRIPHQRGTRGCRGAAS